MEFIQKKVQNLIWQYALYYSYTCLFFMSLWPFVVLLYKRSKLGTRTHYLLWKFVILYPTLVLPGVFVPLFLFRPRNVMNARFTSWFLRKISYITGLTWELRGANIAGMDQGAVICCNHQSAVDIFGQFNVWTQFKRLSAIAKKELFYFFPFGPGAWLCGVQFIDRSSRKKSYQTLSSTAKVMIEGKTKIWIYPEGTRNNKGGFLPFKKGAFFMAIEAQVPIIPLVIAPYYYMDEPNEKFLHENKHNIISVLDPVPTKGLTQNDANELKDKIYSIMLEEYEKLKEEITVKSRDSNWVNQKRPRLTLIDRKFKMP